MDIKTDYKMMFIAGFNSGKRALSDGNNDLPVDFYYESFIEQYGLPNKTLQQQQRDELINVCHDALNNLPKNSDCARLIRETLTKCS